MQIALDTNVLVRHLIADDPVQAAAAKALIDGDDDLVIATIVLCELVWVLRGVYRYARPEIAILLRDIVSMSNVQVDLPAVEAGLRMLERGGDFGDGVIAHDASRTRCDRLVTFDRDFARISASARVVLLATS